LLVQRSISRLAAHRFFGAIPGSRDSCSYGNAVTKKVVSQSVLRVGNGKGRNGGRKKKLNKSIGFDEASNAGGCQTT